jgi:hypothetical protein
MLEIWGKNFASFCYVVQISVFAAVFSLFSGIEKVRREAFLFASVFENCFQKYFETLSKKKQKN